MRTVIRLSAGNSHTARPKVTRMRPLDYVVIIFGILLIPSAVFQGLLGLDEKSAFALFTPFILVTALLTSGSWLDTTIVKTVVSVVIVGMIASAIAMSSSQLLMAIAFSVALVAGRQVYLSLCKPVVLRIVSWITFALLLGGVGGIAYSLVGGPPLLEVDVGYRTTFLYLTTFSFASIGSTIRPSGIFDEPGAFSMFVTIVIMYNDTLKQNNQLNRALVVLLVFTGALAGLALAVLYALFSNDMKSKRKNAYIGLAALACVFVGLSLTMPTNLITTTLDTFYSDRLRIEDGRLAGDNRSNQVEYFLRIVDGEVLLKGTKNMEGFYDSEDMSSNPFSITYGYGLVISLPYFALILWLAGTAVRQGFTNSYASLGLLLLLLQRPYIYHMSWSILIAATIWLIYQTRKLRQHQVGNQLGSRHSRSAM